MTVEQIISVVKKVSGQRWVRIMADREFVRYKYAAIILLYEEIVMTEGKCIQQTLADRLNMPRSTVASLFLRVEMMFDTDKQFKTIYLACIKALAELEDAE